MIVAINLLPACSIPMTFPFPASSRTLDNHPQPSPRVRFPSSTVVVLISHWRFLSSVISLHCRQRHLSYGNNLGISITLILFRQSVTATRCAGMSCAELSCAESRGPLPSDTSSVFRISQWEAYPSISVHQHAFHFHCIVIHLSLLIPFRPLLVLSTSSS